MTILSLDFETASVANLKQTGAYIYAKDPTTIVLCLAWAFDDEDVAVWRPGQPFPDRVVEHVRRLRTVRGWNIGFEWLIWNYVLRRLIPDLPELDLAQLQDTMAHAAYWGLPLKLEDAAYAAGTGMLKDKVGHALMLRMGRPRAFDNVSGKPIWWHETDPLKYQQLIDYCAQDVRAERAIARVIGPVPDIEDRYWRLDQRMNQRGVGLDLDLIGRLQLLAKDVAAQANQEVKMLTSGAVQTVTNAKGLADYLRGIGSPITDLRKDTVAGRLADLDMAGVMDSLERRLLDLRADTAKTSAAKLQAMLLASDAPYTNGVPRVRGMLQYYGATRTGRWAGRLIQLQNLPRGSVKFIAGAIQAVLDGCSIEILEALFGPAMGIVSSALRGCIVAADGNELVVADFAQIEARVIAWLAGQHDILDVFRSGEDVYVYTAAQIGSDNRQLGKVLVLACGFGMSAGKFLETALTYGVVLTPEEAENAVRLWRTNNRKIVSLWKQYESAARQVISAFEVHGTAPVIEVGRVKFTVNRKGHMLIRLPSGRSLVYRDARLADHPLFGPNNVSYMGTNQYTRQWERTFTYGGKLAENVTQAVARDLMADALERADHAGLEPELLVHDEMIGESPAVRAARDLDRLLAIMRTNPSWADGLPLDAAGWHGTRYRK